MDFETAKTRGYNSEMYKINDRGYSSESEEKIGRYNSDALQNIEP